MIILPIHGQANNDATADKKTHATKKTRKEDDKKKKDARIAAANKVAENFFCQQPGQQAECLTTQPPSSDNISITTCLQIRGVLLYIRT